MDISNKLENNKVQMESLIPKSTLDALKEEDKGQALQDILRAGKLDNKLKELEQKRKNINAIVEENRINRTMQYDDNIDKILTSVEQVLNKVLENEEFKSSDLKNLTSALETLNKLQERNSLSLTEIKEETPNNIVVRFAPPKE